MNILAVLPKKSTYFHITATELKIKQSFPAYKPS